jgi:hypothetical protein
MQAVFLYKLLRHSHTALYGSIMEANTATFFDITGAIRERML